jgi:hypothetical protein
MARITVVLAMICALNAFVTYPSADAQRQAAVDTMARAMM